MTDFPGHTAALNRRYTFYISILYSFVLGQVGLVRSLVNQDPKLVQLVDSVRLHGTLNLKPLNALS